MGEPKTFASLSSGLLARKGAARPAMRPQGFGQIGATLEDLGWNDMGFEPPKPVLSAVRDEDHDAFGDETGESGARHPLAGLTPFATPSPVHDQQAELAERFAGYDLEAGEEDEYDSTAEPFDGADDIRPMIAAPVAREAQRTARKTTQRSAPGSKSKAAFTLRLDPARHLKLRLACAVTNRSAQMLVTDALDRLLKSMPELDGMAANAPTSCKLN